MSIELGLGLSVNKKIKKQSLIKLIMKLIKLLNIIKYYKKFW